METLNSTLYLNEKIYQIFKVYFSGHLLMIELRLCNFETPNIPQLAFTCSNATIETLQKAVIYVQS